MTTPFTVEEMSRVFNTNLIDYARSQGFPVKRADRKSYHIKGYSGLYVFPKGYHHFSRGEGGNIIDFAREFQGLSFIEAVENILGVKAYENTITTISPQERGKLVLPKRSEDQTKTIAYLTEERCLDKDLVFDLITQGKIYQAVIMYKGAVFENCAFVSFDEKNTPRYCALRGLNGSTFRQDVRNSDKSYGFLMNGTSNRIFCFESPIDAISHASLMKLNEMDDTTDYRISEGCLSDKALSRFLQSNSHIKEIVFAFDNDIDGKDHKGRPFNHGQEFAKKCVAKFRALGYVVFIQSPERKDFNADLQYVQKSVLKQLEKNKSKSLEQSSTKVKEHNHDIR